MNRSEPAPADSEKLKIGQALSLLDFRLYMERFYMRGKKDGGSVAKQAGRKRKYLIIAAAVAAALLLCIAFVPVSSVLGRKEFREPVTGNSPRLPGEYSPDADGRVKYGGRVYEYDDDNINILCMGVDARGGENTVGQADTNVLVVFNTREKTVRCLNINRDCLGPVKIFGVAGDYITTQNVQIAVAFSYGGSVEDGSRLMCETVSELLYGLPIHGWAVMDIDGIGGLNSAVGGVKLTALDDIEKAGISKGDELTLTDEQAVLYVTERDSSSENVGTNAARMDRQKQYISLWCDRLADETGRNPRALYDVYGTLSDYIETDISKRGILYLAGLYGKGSFGESDMYSVPGEYRRGGYYDEYVVDESAAAKILLDIFYRETE